MAKYLLSLHSSGSLASARAAALPPDYLVDFSEDEGGGTDDGLDHWRAELEVAGAIADWTKGPAFEALWAFFDAALADAEVRPRCALSIRSHVDGRRVGVAFAYLGDQEIRRARESVRQRIQAAIDPKSRKLTGDVDLAVHR